MSRIDSDQMGKSTQRSLCFRRSCIVLGGLLNEAVFNKSGTETQP